VTTFNDAIRRAARCNVSAPLSAVREGSIGIGKGGAAGLPRARDHVAARFNAEVRLTAGVVRARARLSDLLGSV
jgi:hypothetical protein